MCAWVDKIDYCNLQCEPPAPAPPTMYDFCWFNTVPSFTLSIGGHSSNEKESFKSRLALICSQSVIEPSGWGGGGGGGGGGGDVSFLGFERDSQGNPGGMSLGKPVQCHASHTCLRLYGRSTFQAYQSQPHIYTTPRKWSKLPALLSCLLPPFIGSSPLRDYHCLLSLFLNCQSLWRIYW